MDKLMWEPLVSRTLFRLLRPAPLSLVSSAADAFGKGNDCGAGGWLRFPNGTMRWFSQHFTVRDFNLGTPVQADANLDISSDETLAQRFVLLCFWRCLGGGRWLCNCLHLDNSGTESVNKLYTSEVPLELTFWSQPHGEENDKLISKFSSSDKLRVEVQLAESLSRSDLKRLIF
eukprot:s6315_g2.t1